MRRLWTTEQRQSLDGTRSRGPLQRCRARKPSRSASVKYHNVDELSCPYYWAVSCCNLRCILLARVAGEERDAHVLVFTIEVSVNSL